MKPFVGPTYKLLCFVDMEGINVYLILALQVQQSQKQVSAHWCCWFMLSSTMLHWEPPSQKHEGKEEAVDKNIILILMWKQMTCYFYFNLRKVWISCLLLFFIKCGPIVSILLNGKNIFLLSHVSYWAQAFPTFPPVANVHWLVWARGKGWCLS